MSTYLQHSRGPWKNHKYIKKIGNAYVYAKNALSYQRRASKNKQDHDSISKLTPPGSVHKMLTTNGQYRDRSNDLAGWSYKKTPSLLKASNVQKYDPNNGAPRSTDRQAAGKYRAMEANKRTAKNYSKAAKRELKNLGREIGLDVKKSGKNLKSSVINTGNSLKRKASSVNVEKSIARGKRKVNAFLNNSKKKASTTRRNMNKKINKFMDRFVTEETTKRTVVGDGKNTTYVTTKKRKRR